MDSFSAAHLELRWLRRLQEYLAFRNTDSSISTLIKPLLRHSTAVWGVSQKAWNQARAQIGMKSAGGLY